MKKFKNLIIFTFVLFQISSAFAKIEDGKYSCQLTGNDGATVRTVEVPLDIQTINSEKTIKLGQLLNFTIDSECTILKVDGTTTIFVNEYTGDCFNDDTISIRGFSPNKQNLFIYNFDNKVSATWKVEIKGVVETYELPCKAMQ